MAVPATVLAHVEGGAAEGFVSGFLHPLSGWDHIAAMVAVGLWGAQLGRPAIWVLPVTFPLVMAFGGFLGLLGVPLPGVEPGIARRRSCSARWSSLQARPPLWLAIAIVAVFAVFHGYAHGAELGARRKRGRLQPRHSSSPPACCTASASSIGLVHSWPAGRRLCVSSAALIVGAGVFFMYRALA